jgi:xanthine dehydrogenase accessory factor
MALLSGGQIIGTVGGGAGEAKVLEAAHTVLQSGHAQLIHLNFSGRPAELGGVPGSETEGICGGQMRVWVQRCSGPQALAIMQQICHKLEGQEPLTLITPLNSDLPYLEEEGKSLFDQHCQCLVERLNPTPSLLIVGAGHVAQPLARMAAMIGFKTSILDERSDWNSVTRFPEVIRFVTPIGETLPQLLPAPSLFVALVTRSYLHDLEALRLLLPHSLHYLGMIGSRRRIQSVFQILQQEGFTQEQLSRIHAPIGLDLGALTPAEIAVSIAAELIQVRRQGSSEGHSLQLQPQTLRRND